MWLLLEDILNQIMAPESQGWQPSAEQLAEFSAEDRVTGERIMRVTKDRAEINVQGVLTKTPSIFARYFGGGNTTYAELIAAVQAAEADPDVSTIAFRFDSPGGNTNGLFEAMGAIANATKSTEGIAELAASAAYGLASQVDTLKAASPASMIGSVGVVATYYVDDDVVEITSSNAPKKRPDARTEEGKADIREFLDQIEEQFIEGIASGRDVSADTVKSDFGRGGMMLAKKALAANMIDGIMDASSAPSATNKPVPVSGEKKMDLNELKAQHPGIFNEAVAVGATQERRRIAAHLEFAKPGGEAAMKIATDAIEKGEECDALYMAKYHNASLNRKDAEAREDDDAEANVETAKNPPKKTKDEETEAHNATLRELGIDPEGGE